MRIGIIDHHPIFRLGLRAAVESFGGLELAGEGSTREDAWHLAEQVDILTLALDLPEAGGIDLVEGLLSRRPDLKVIVVSMLSERIYAEKCVRAGAAGFVSKLEGLGDVHDALRAVLDGEVYLGKRALRGVLRRLAGGGPAENPMETLTSRELEVFRLLSNGSAIKAIAAHLFLSPKTIETHVAKLKRKIGVTTLTELRQRAVAWRMACYDTYCSAASACPHRPQNCKMAAAK